MGAEGIQGIPTTPGDDARNQTVGAVEEIVQNTNTEASIENEPLAPIIEKHRSKIEERFAQARELDKKAGELRAAGKHEEYAWADTHANEIRATIFSGVGGPGKPREGFLEFPPKVLGHREKEDEVIKQYRDAIHDSPQMILRMAEESGGLNTFGGIAGISPRLLRDKEFISALAKTKGAQQSPEFQVALRDNLFARYAANAR